MNIKEAQYYTSVIPNSLKCIKVIEPSGKILYVPQDPANTDYAEILKQVKEKKLTVKEAK